MYQINYKDYTRSCIPVQLRQIIRLYTDDSSFSIYLKLRHPITHYIEELDEYSLATLRRNAMYSTLVDEVALDIFVDLKPIICLQFFDKAMFFKVFELINGLLPTQRKSKQILHCKETEISSLFKDLKTKLLLFSSLLTKLSFQVQYLIFCLLSVGLLTLLSLSPEFFDILLSCKAEQATGMLESLFIQHLKLKSDDLIEKLRQLKKEEFKSIPNYEPNYYYVRRVLITPSMIYCHWPILQQSSRVLRKYMSSDNLLRVTFRENNLNPIRFCSTYIEQIRCVLSNGLIIGKQKFVFFAYSQAQIREQSCWLISSEIKPCNILSTIGIFNLNQSASLVESRIGLAFTTTIPVSTLCKNNVKMQEDIIRNKFIFSDGIGKMSKDLCLLCQKQTKYPTSTAFQIRLAGFKGVLMLCPNLLERTVIVRPSMKKFESDDYTLEIVRAASYMKGFLNRELIVLLGTLGVPDNILADCQARSIELLLQSLTTHDANNEGKEHCFDCTDYPSYLWPTFQYLKMEKDPFGKSLLLVSVLKNLKKMVKKANIFIEQSCRLIGVLCETRELAEDEVFIQIEEPGKERKILTGRVFVTKNPCLHPGNIRILNAVNNEKLKYLINVIVFSSQGNRPCFNMMGNGDLDGDIYFICWDKKIFPLRIAEPMQPSKKSFTKISAKDECPINSMGLVQEDIKDFFCTFLHSDNIGRISNLYMAHADQSEQRAFSKECIELAEMHSISVDYAKHGNEVSSSIISSYKVSKSPDFMLGNKLRPDKSKYQSNKALGLMYRQIIEVYKKILQTYQKEKLEEVEEQINCTFLVEGFEEYLCKSMNEYIDFSRDIKKLMVIYGAALEAELISGLIIKIEKSQKHARRDYEIKQELIAIIQKMILFYNKNNEDNLKKASARYFIVYYNKDTDKILENSEGSRKILKNDDFLRFTRLWNTYNDSNIHLEKEGNKGKINKIWSFPWVLSGEELIKIVKNKKNPLI